MLRYKNCLVLILLKLDLLQRILNDYETIFLCLPFITRKYFQIVIHGTTKANFVLSSPCLETQNCRDVEFLLLNRPDQISVYSTLSLLTLTEV